VAGRHVEGDVVEAVAVEADSEGEVELAGGGDEDCQPDLASLLSR